LHRTNKYIMSQINIKITETFKSPPAQYKGYGFNIYGQPVAINGDGSTTVLTSSTTSLSNVVANKGVGLQADLPGTFVAGDVYVTTDTFRIYTAVDIISWSYVDLISSQFILDLLTDLSYQYNGTILQFICYNEHVNINVNNTEDFGNLVVNVDYFPGNEITLLDNDYEETEIWKYMYDNTLGDYELKLRSRITNL